MDSVDVEEVFRGINMNYKVAEYGLKLIGFNEIINQVNYKIKYFCMAASGARMSGADLPVMSSGGSGNQGIVSILPVAIVGEELRIEKTKIAKAVALSHFISGYIKSKLGKIAPVCGCVNAASPGAAAGITYLFNGSQEQIMLAVKTVLSDTLGMFCDGAKESCALKAGIAAQEAYDASLLAMRNIGIKDCQGFLDKDFNKTMENIVEIGKNGLTKLDEAIIKVLEKRN
jgi:L-cysteine desulfidase